MAQLLEAYESNAIPLAKMYSFAELNLLLNQTAKLRRDPEAVKAEVDRAKSEEWIDDNRDARFTFTDPEGNEEFFSLGEFLN